MCILYAFLLTFQHTAEELASETLQSSGKRLHVDVREDDVVQDVDSVDLVELPDPVPELEQRDVVDRHPEGLGGAEDLHLEENHQNREGR